MRHLKTEEWVKIFNAMTSRIARSVNLSSNKSLFLLDKIIEIKDH
ncbi:hypothetical protein NW062_04125 [Mycoplasmopsis cynos]|nr:hypothetical protein NW062_04125 [Mycoplasmopsis cynos]